jgi:hypothetical protein
MSTCGCVVICVRVSLCLCPCACIHACMCTYRDGAFGDAENAKVVYDLRA